MGLFDRAKQLAEQAKEKAEEALSEVRARTQSSSEGDAGVSAAPTAAPPADPRMGTPYVAGMLGRPGWRERGLEDPAAVLPIADRDRAGIPHSTRSEVVEEPFGMGRRWTSGGRSVGLFYRLYPEHRSWHPPGTAPLPELPGASIATLDDGRSLVLFAGGDVPMVLEVSGLDDMARGALAQAVAGKLAG